MTEPTSLPEFDSDNEAIERITVFASAVGGSTTSRCESTVAASIFNADRWTVEASVRMESSVDMTHEAVNAVAILDG